ncbi:MAG: CRTAC1 family protein [Bacteriovoracaceae bacterium]|nr:CRTAC1 family protein [Bacteriovoracaceae bacterium]
MTLSIFNFWGVLIAFMILGCSSSKSTPQVEVIKPKKSTVKKSKAEKNVVSGPTSTLLSPDFSDMTKAYGLMDVEASLLYATDFNNDGWTDLVVLPNYYSSPVFFLYDKDQSKFNKINYSPFVNPILASYLGFYDLDKDGVNDLVVGTVKQKTQVTQYPLRVFKGEINDKGEVHYTQVDSGVGSVMPTTSVIFLDYNLDGHLDLFLSNWHRHDAKFKGFVPDKLLQGKGFKFIDVSKRLIGEYDIRQETKNYHNAKPTYSASICDIDQNGYPDILTSSTSGYNNKLWLNLHDKKFGRIFRDFGKASGYAADKVGELKLKGGGNTLFSTCADYNNDTVMDVLVGELSHSYDPESRDRSSVLTGSTLSFPPKFYRTIYTNDLGMDSWNQADRRGVFFDYDIDGLEDILIDNSGLPPNPRTILFKQQKNHSYDDVATLTGIDILNPSGSIVMDINQDGLLDLVLGQNKVRNAKMTSRLYVFINKIKRNKKRSIRFFLEGDSSNSDAVGAMVTLKTNMGTIRKWVHYTFGPYPSQIEVGTTFGLGSDRRIAGVEVKWPVLDKKTKLPLVKHYNISRLRLKSHLDVTLCEGGKFFIGKSKSKCK